jgi:hypothetical protein
VLGRVDDVAGIPRIFAKTLLDPPGRTVSGVGVPGQPLAISLTVPSPPNATTTSNFSSAAEAISSVAWPRRWVSIASTS